MNWLKPLSICIILLFQIIGYAQKPLKTKLKISLRPVENFRHHLDKCDVIFYENNIKYDSTRLKGHVLKHNLSNRSLYKIEFKKDGYVSKHIIVNTVNIPNHKRYKEVLKADVSLFIKSTSQNVSFLKNEPISIAYYNEIKGALIWDFEYNRSIVEKIIHAQTVE
jgi:hypothetical protein